MRKRSEPGMGCSLDHTFISATLSDFQSDIPFIIKKPQSIRLNRHDVYSSDNSVLHGNVREVTAGWTVSLEYPNGIHDSECRSDRTGEVSNSGVDVLMQAVPLSTEGAVKVFHGHCALAK